MLCHHNVKMSLLRWSALLVSVNVILLIVIIMLLAFPSNKSKCVNLNKRSKDLQRIVGGREVRGHEFPFMVGLAIVGYGLPKLQCGASIISRYWVICAAHCIELVEKAGYRMFNARILAGHWKWRRAHQYNVAKTIKNKDYDRITASNDISLIKVRQPFHRQHEGPIALASLRYKYVVNSTATVIGWGRNHTYSNLIQEQLFAVDVLIFNHTYCDYLYDSGTVTKDMFCAGTYEGGKDACQFDSGGPIIQNGVLIGIVSWGGECGKATEPGVYVKMSYFFSWIRKVDKEEKLNIGWIVSDTAK